MKFPKCKDWIRDAPHLNPEGLSRDIGNLTVLAPHPDDESLGCWGLISLLVAQGKKIHIIFVTDGSASHPGSRQYPPKILKAIRKDEAISACEHLGVGYEHLTFMEKADSKMHTPLDDELWQIAFSVASMYEQGNFSALAMPWRRDPHADRKVVHEIGCRALELITSGATKIEYPIWLWENGSIEDWPEKEEVNPFRLDISSVTDRKAAAIQEHLSQLGRLIEYDTDGFVLTEDLLLPFHSKTEYFFLTNRRNPKKLQGDYFENLYTYNSDPWNFKTSEYELAKYDLIIKTTTEYTICIGLELGCSIGIQTRMLAEVCQSILAVDVSSTAVAQAREECIELTNVAFECADIATSFPPGPLDMITLCELGYYFDEPTLMDIYSKISDVLDIGGKLLMVHWTSYVPDYPLTGTAVHEIFEHYVKKKGNFRTVFNESQYLFRIQVWERMGSKQSK